MPGGDQDGDIIPLGGNLVPLKYLIPERCLPRGDEVGGYIRLKGDRDRFKARGQTVTGSLRVLVSKCSRRMQKEELENLAHHVREGR